jgi:beta-lactamase regulating signal transducer with metallopeptidase domain
MNAWIDALNAISATWFDLLVRASWQGGIALAAVWLISRFLPRIPAGHKVWLWRLAFLKLLAALVWFSPVVLPVLPQQAPPAPIADGTETILGAEVATEALPTAMSPETPRPVLHFRAWLFLAWCVAILLFAARLLRHWRETRRLLRASRPLNNADVEESARLLGERLHIRSSPAIADSPAISSPVLIGIFRPRIILPRDLAQSASLSRLELMLAHELAHVRRRDLVWLWLFTIVEALFFFHPMVWLARREWTLATEAACDDLALRVTRQTPCDYGEMLIDIVAATSRTDAAPLLAVGMVENANTLKRRLKLMITTRTRLARIGGIALITIASFALVPWKLTAQPADAEAVAKLKEENARLREQLEAIRKDAEQMRADAEQLRKRVVDERQTEAAVQRENAELQSRFAREQARNIERQYQAMEKLQMDLDELLTKFSNEHPEVRRKIAELQTTKERIAELEADDSVMTLRPGSRTKTARLAADPRASRAMKHHDQQRALLQKEIELGERHVENVRKALDNGKEIAASLLTAQRELLDAKLQLARLSNSKADQRAVLFQQLSVAEHMLKEQKRKIEVGTLPPGAEIPFEREVLRIKRELYALDGPDLNQ